MTTDSVLRPAMLQLPTEQAEMQPISQEFPPLPRQTLAEAHANTFAWMKVRAATAQDLRKAVSDLEKFTGEVGELNHFIKGGDRLMSRINVKIEENLIDPGDAESIRAELICRVKRNILNLIQADEETPWAVVKERLKKAYGGGRWSIEEDIFLMFRETRRPRQSCGQYAGELLSRYNKITEKMRETQSAAEVEARMVFLSTILRVQLAREAGRKEGLPRERSFVECAQDMIDASAREEESRMDVDETPWNRVSYRRPRVEPTVWRRSNSGYESKEKFEGKRQSQRRSRPNGRKDDRKCHGCGKVGHLVAQCPRTKCFECGMEGHIARQCPYMFRRREPPDTEAMEVNAQRVWRRTRPPSESTGSSTASETDEERIEPGRSGDDRRVSTRRRGASERRVTAERRARDEE